MSFLDKLQEKLLPIATKLDSNRYLTAIKTGFFAAMPMLIIGSMFLLVTQIPIPPYLNFMERVLGENWVEYFLKINVMAMDIMTLYVIFGISKSLGNHYGLHSLSTQTAAVFAFLILTPTYNVEEGSFLPIGNFGAEGLFVGMISAILAVEVFRWVSGRGWTIKMPDSVPPNVARSFESLIPAFVVAIVFNVIRICFEKSSFGTAHNFILTYLQKPLLSLSNTLPAFMIIMFLDTLFWSFGIHGSNIIVAVMAPIWNTLTVENAGLIKQGLDPNNVITMQFYENFVKMGGSGSTIGLALALVVFAKSEQYKTLGKLAIAPSIFNINEPIIFGVPIVLNPIMIIPFILVPQVLSIVTYISMKTGLVPLTNGLAIPWTTPPIISGLLVSGWRGALLQAFNIFLSFVIYYAFFNVIDKKAYDIEQQKES